MRTGNAYPYTGLSAFSRDYVSNGLNQYTSSTKAGVGTVYGRFGYTGQAWLPEVGLYYYKARMYSPTLGRFLQTDPIGYGDGANWYAYVGNDPVNAVDPLGLCEPVKKDGGAGECDPIIITGQRIYNGSGTFGGGTLQPHSSPKPSQPKPNPKPMPKPKWPQPNALCGSPNDGPVDFKIDEFTTAPGGGITVAWGTFTTESGGQGSFEFSGFALGFDLGVAQRHGSADNLGTFTGTSDSFGGGYAAFSFSFSRSQSSGSWYGSVGLGVGKAKIGGSVSTTDTNIISMTCP